MVYFEKNFISIKIPCIISLVLSGFIYILVFAQSAPIRIQLNVVFEANKSILTTLRYRNLKQKGFKEHCPLKPLLVAGIGFEPMTFGL